MVVKIFSQLRNRKLVFFVRPGPFKWQLRTSPVRQAQYLTNFRSGSSFDNRSGRKSFSERYNEIYEERQGNKNTTQLNDGVKHYSEPAGSSAEIIDSDRDYKISSNSAHLTEFSYYDGPNDQNYPSSYTEHTSNQIDDSLSTKNYSPSLPLEGLIESPNSIHQSERFDITSQINQPSSTPVQDLVSNSLKRTHIESSHFSSELISSRDPSEDKLLSFFKSTITRSNDTALSSTTASVVSHENHVLNAIINNDSLLDSWRIFEENLCTTSQTSSSPIIKQISNILINRIIISKQIDPFDSTLPSIKEFANAMSQHGYLDCSQWADLVMVLLERVSTIKGKPIDDTILVLDIIGAWDLATRKQGSSQPLSTSEIRKIYEKSGLDILFGTTVPYFKGGNFTKIPIVAIATFSVLMEALPTLGDQSTRILPLLKSIAVSIDIPNLDISPLKLKNVSVAVKSYIFKNWTGIREKACQVMGSSRESGNKPALLSHESENNQAANIAPSLPMRGMLSIHHQLRSAINLMNHAKLDELWSEVSQWQPNNSEGNLGLSGRNEVLSGEICNHFIMAYMKLRRPSQSIEVWIHMCSKGLNPSNKTWNIAMSGCSSTGDWRSLEKLWKMMILSGFKPDAFSWSTRLSVLMKTKQTDMAIQALDEMGRLWLEKATKAYPNLNTDKLLLVENVENAVKPDVSCINAVVNGLMLEGNKFRAYQIISWARNFGVKPDTATYNILLRRLARNKNNNELMLLLKQMEKEEVEADVITFTIILDEILLYPSQYEPEKLKEIIDDIFMNMDRANVRPNEYTYGKIIYQLVRDLNRNYSPIVDLVMQDMLKRGMKPTVPLYTNLLEYYLLQNPPNIDMGRHIVDNATSIVGLDRVFWDKVIECYAQIGETSAALNLIRKLSGENLRVGWTSMRRLLEALLVKREWHLARGLVRDVQISSARHYFQEGTKSEETFWELAAKVNDLEA